MRARFQILVLLGIVLLPIRAAFVNAQDPFLDAHDVPIPPDTFHRAENHWTENVGGYVPNVYSQAAPEPPDMLRPRYRQDSSSGKIASKHGSKPPKKSNAIRQASTDKDPFTFSEPASLVPSPAVQQDFGIFDQEEFGRRRMTPSQDHPLELHTINNTHTCDDLTCGPGGCGAGDRAFGDGNGHTSYRDHAEYDAPSGRSVGQWYFDGWLNVGSFMNTHWPEDRNNAPLYFNDRNGETVLNQLYLSLGRRIDPRKKRWDIGGRIDLLYGTDFFHTSSLGLETRREYVFGGQTRDPLEAVQHWNSNTGHRRSGTASLYGLSMPQAYAEIFMPLGNGVTIKAGHFYADVGLESAMAPQNFFYSHSYNFMHGSPITLTGATATVQLGPRLSVEAGFTSGWNVFDSPTGDTSGLFGLRLKSLDRRSALSFMVHTGEDTSRTGANRTNYSLTFQRKIGRRWQYALEHGFGYEENGAFLDVLADRRGPARWYSLAQYLQFQWSEKLSFGFRAEWFRDDGHSRIQKSPVSMPFWELSGENYYELTLGAHWKPTRFLTIRPEIRYDWSDVQVNGQGGVFSGYAKRDMLSFAIDGVLRF